MTPTSSLRVRTTAALLGAFLASASLAASAQTSTDAEVAALQAEVAAMRAEMAALRGGAASWQAADREAETRRIVDAAIAESGSGGDSDAFGGFNGKKFLLEGGGSSLELGGQFQFRYVFNSDDARDDEGEGSLDGFEIRRAKLSFDGNIISPKLEYSIVLATNDNNGDAFLEDALIGYEFDNGVELKVGRFKLPFAYEELLSSKRQLGVDRSISTEFFTLGRSEQIQVVIPAGDSVKNYVAFSDGANVDAQEALNDTSDFAFTGRSHIRFAGDWDQQKDLVAFDEEFALFLGVAGHLEKFRENDPDVDGDTTFAYTADVIVKTGNLVGFGALYGATADEADLNQFGFVVQGGYNVTKKLQPFARFDFIDNDVTDVSAVTAGVNYFFKGHNAKFTLDGVFIIEPDGDIDANAIAGLNGGAFSSGIGLNDDGLNGEDDQFAIRAQFQLLF